VEEINSISEFPETKILGQKPITNSHDDTLNLNVCVCVTNNFFCYLRSSDDSGDWRPRLSLVKNDDRPPKAKKLELIGARRLQLLSFDW